MTFRIGPFLLAALCSVVFIYLVLALAEAGGLAACHWAFPRWFGCVLYVHESLAAGLIAVACVDRRLGRVERGATADQR
jgi:hypothetical protein